ncbi:27115_t:CDS:2, partial [Racocetra persica]
MEISRKRMVPSDQILSAYRLSQRLASQICLKLHCTKYPKISISLIYRPKDGRKQNCMLEKEKAIDWELGYVMTIYTSQGMILKALQHIEDAKNKKAIKCSLRLFISKKLIGYMDQDKKKS